MSYSVTVITSLLSLYLYLSLPMWCRFQQLGGDPSWAARGGRRKGKGRSDSSSSDSETEEDGILQRTGQNCVL